MAQIKGLYKTAEKLDEFSRRASGSLIHHMKVNNISDEKIAKRMNIQARTVQNRIKDPGSIKLRDLWEMAIIIGCPVGEIAGGALPEEVLGRVLAEAMKKERSD